MKNLFLTCSMMLICVISMAQVKYFEGSLNEAFAKAKTEKKSLLIMGSATW